ncbi:MAG: hypothetical protein H0X51_07930 [Parachlamydiaceae bacterium]|nr:hypothetical protein [Parachlamydiaceae bacterium]
MQDPTTLYVELLNLMKLHLAQTYPSGTWIPSDRNTQSYFRQHVTKTPKVQTPKPPEPIRTPPAPKPEVVYAPPVSVPVKPKEPIALIEEKRAPEIKAPKSNKMEHHPLPSAPDCDFNDFKQIIADKFPQYKIVEHAPCDSTAKQKSNAWQQPKTIPAAVVLSFDSQPKNLQFLHNVARAINFHVPADVMSAAQIEQDMGWEAFLSAPSLRLVIASDGSLHHTTKLMAHYRESSKQAKHYLGQIPFCPLSDLSLYCKEPKLKAALWLALRTMI